MVFPEGEASKETPTEEDITRRVSPPSRGSTASTVPTARRRSEKPKPTMWESSWAFFIMTVAALSLAGIVLVTILLDAITF